MEKSLKYNGTRWLVVLKNAKKIYFSFMKALTNLKKGSKGDPV